jgi:catechol 2,3-dioxygenase
VTKVPKRLLSQLAHVELVNPDPERSAWFFHDVLGLEETTREGDSIYFRGWGENLHHSLVLTEGPEALGHIAWRAAGPEELEDAAARLEASGHGEGWVDPVTGHGRAYRFRGPGGHSRRSSGRSSATARRVTSRRCSRTGRSGTARGAWPSARSTT